MASGTVTISTQSVDYNGGGPYTRGAYTLTNVVGWNVDSDNRISFTSISSTDNVGGQWGVCTTGSGRLFLEPQVSYDNGASWQTITSASVARAVCPNLTNTISASISLIGQLGTPTLQGDCQLRILYYADGTPVPDASLPHAFPNSSYSAAVQVPVVIEVSYRPGATFNGTLWQSNNKTNGACHILTNTTTPVWTEMTTSGGDDGSQGNPPLIAKAANASSWYNTRRIGKE